MRPCLSESDTGAGRKNLKYVLEKKENLWYSDNNFKI